MKKILIVTSYISTSKNLKFYQSQQINLAKELIKKGLDVSIISGKRYKDMPNHQIIDDVKIEFLKVSKFFPEFLFNQTVLKNLWRSLKKNKPDIIQSSEYHSFITLVCAVFVFFNKNSKLIIYQGIYTDSDNFILKAFNILWDLLFGKIIKSQTNLVVCKTRKSEIYLQSKNFKKSCVIPVGVNTQLFYPLMTQRSDSLVSFLVVGNLIKLKNYSFIIKSFYFFKMKSINFEVKIIGKGPLRESLINEIRSFGLENNISIIEDIPNYEMINYYNLADFTLSLSIKEIFGMTILESLSCGTPVLSNFMPGPTDIIKDGFNGFNLNTPTEFSNELVNVLNKNNFHSKQIANDTKAKYGWESIANKYLTLYNLS
jgi:glycosyltransferase involved in cell wall biosynthesis